MNRTRCCNSEPGTFNHECGKPASWIGSRESTETPGRTHLAPFCDRCKADGWEARDFKTWTHAETVQTADGPRLQAILAGTQPQAQQARASRDSKNGGRLRKGCYAPPGGMFEPVEQQLFDNPRTNR